MRLDWNTTSLVQVALSRRNLLSLLDGEYLDKYISDTGTVLRVCPESDEQHYDETASASGQCAATSPEGFCTLEYGHGGPCNVEGHLPPLGARCN